MVAQTKVGFIGNNILRLVSGANKASISAEGITEKEALHNLKEAVNGVILRQREYMNANSKKKGAWKTNSMHTLNSHYQKLNAVNAAIDRYEQGHFLSTDTQTYY